MTEYLKNAATALASWAILVLFFGAFLAKCQTSKTLVKCSGQAYSVATGERRPELDKNGYFWLDGVGSKCQGHHLESQRATVFYRLK